MVVTIRERGEGKRFWCGETQEEDYTVVVAIRGGGGRLFSVGRDTGREVHGGSSDKRKRWREII